MDTNRSTRSHVKLIRNVEALSAGYEHALREAGLGTLLELIAQADGFGIEHGARGVHQPRGKNEPPTAIFANADMRCIRVAGLRIPQDISLTGFNDVPLAVLVEPPLTTVRAIAFDLGRIVMAMPSGLVAAEGPPARHVVLPTALVIRDSCRSHGHYH